MKKKTSPIIVPGIVEGCRRSALHNSPGPMTTNIFAGIALNAQQLSRRWTSSSQAILGKIRKAIVALEEHLLTAGFDAVAPKHVHVLNVLVVIPRRYPIDGIANVEHERRIVKTVHAKIIMDVAVDHLG